MVEFKTYYVYIAKDGEEVVYVGSGNGNRIKHVNSGYSHNKELNNHVRANGPLNVTKVVEDVSSAKSIFEEQRLIDFHRPKYNKSRPFGVSHSVSGYNYNATLVVLRTEYLKLSKAVLDAVEEPHILDDATCKMKVLFDAINYIERCSGDGYVPETT